MTVCANTIRKWLSIKPANRLSPMICAINIPILFPTSMVEINSFEFLKKMERIRDVIPPLRSISKRNLSTETNAISIPEKKAEKAIVMSKEI